MGSAPRQSGRDEALAPRQARGLSIRSAAGQFGISPRFLHQLEHGKPTARMDKVLHALEGRVEDEMDGIAFDVAYLDELDEHFRRKALDEVRYASDLR